MLVQNHTSPSVKAATEQVLFSFGPFTLDVSRGLLSRNGEAISLRPKAFDVLIFLLQHPGRLVSREELIGAVWPGVIVTDDSLTQCLTEIRRALGDNQRAIVRTVPRRGYLFELPVEVSVATAIEPGQQGRSWWRLPSLWTVIALVILALAVGASWWRSGSQTGQPTGNPLAPPPGEVSIAVLPFIDLSETGDQEFLSYGISEEILNLLSQVEASSTAYWISGLSTIGSISFGLALVAGRKRVPRPATGKTADLILTAKAVPLN